MRTTVTLDDDTLAMIKRRMAARGTSFKEAINDAIREGAADKPAPPPFRTRTADLGGASMNVDRALQVAADMEDAELIRRLRRNT